MVSWVWGSNVRIVRWTGVRIPVGGRYSHFWTHPFSITLDYLSEWFIVNGWTLIMNKTNIVKISSKHYQDKTFLINYKNNSIKESTNTKFLGLELDKHINWKNHINKILPRCIIVRSVYSNSNMSILKMIYFAYFNFNFNLFLFIWSDRGFWPTGYRTSQINITL